MEEAMSDEKQSPQGQETIKPAGGKMDAANEE
jgi:hypothetical protein